MGTRNKQVNSNSARITTRDSYYNYTSSEEITRIDRPEGHGHPVTHKFDRENCDINNDVIYLSCDCKNILELYHIT